MTILCHIISLPLPQTNVVFLLAHDPEKVNKYEFAKRIRWCVKIDIIIIIIAGGK
jgi:hypothetical protein